MELVPLIQKISSIQKDISENQTLISTVLPMFQYLQWNIFDENRVIYEDTTSTKKRVDITFIFNNGTKFLVEVKRLSHKLSMKDFEQLTLYLNSDDMVNIGILTNGIDYWIADNKQDGLDNKKVYHFNLFEVTECDLNVLNIFFSFEAYHNLTEINRYIDYIQTGIDFGDKECSKFFEKGSFNEKILEKKKVDAPEVEPKKEESLEQKSDEKSEEIKAKTENSEVKKIPEKIEKNNFNNDESKPKIENEEAKKTPEKIEKNIEKTSEPKSEPKKQEVEIINIPKNEKNIIFFELVDRNKVKIMLFRQYHILQDDSFSAVFVKTIRYIFEKLSTSPALISKIIAEFDFIISSNNRTVKSAKYETVFNNYYIDTNINSYTKIVNIEKILKFISESN